MQSPVITTQEPELTHIKAFDSTNEVEFKFLERMYGKFYTDNSESDIRLNIHFQSRDLNKDLKANEMELVGSIFIGDTKNPTEYTIEKGIVLFSGSHKTTFLQYHLQTKDFYLHAEKHVNLSSVPNPYKIWKDTSSIFFTIRPRTTHRLPNLFTSTHNLHGSGRMSIWEPEYPVDQIIGIETKFRNQHLKLKWLRYLSSTIARRYYGLLV